MPYLGLGGWPNSHKFTSDLTPADLLMARMAANHILHMHPTQLRSNSWVKLETSWLHTTVVKNSIRFMASIRNSHFISHSNEFGWPKIAKKKQHKRNLYCFQTIYCVMWNQLKFNYVPKASIMEENWDCFPIIMCKDDDFMKKVVKCAKQEGNSYMSSHGGLWFLDWHKSFQSKIPSFMKLEKRCSNSRKMVSKKFPTPSEFHIWRNPVRL